MRRSRNGRYGPLLTDTHVWLWLALDGTSRFPPRTRLELERASGANQLWVSAISIWEIAMFEAKGRIELTQDLREWIMPELAAPGMNLIGLRPAIAMESVRLPGEFHGDRQIGS